MNGNASRLVRYSLGLLGLVTLGWVLAGNAAKPVQKRVSLPTDWSHSHLIFSHGATAKRARQVQEDPRYWQQIQRQIPHVTPTRVSLGGAQDFSPASAQTPRRRRIHRDWSVNLGAGGSVGAGNFPAKFSFDSTTADCTNDYVVFSTGLQGGPTQANLVAFNNLYSGCGGTVPSVLWAANTSLIPVRILTSPALSLDGSQIAFVQTAGPAAQLVLLTWGAGGSVTLPTIPVPLPHAAYRGCTGPCMTTFDLTDALGVTHFDDRTSSVFIDYNSDTAWVGDSSGLLHKFTGVFLGTPAEVVNGSFPKQVSTGALSSPVFDHVSLNVLAAGVSDGFLYRVDSTSGATVTSRKLDFSPGIVAGPVVDSGNGTVYVSVSNDGSQGCLNGATTVDCAGVLQFSVGFGGSDLGSEAVVGISTDFHVGPANPMYNGFFDSSYLNSEDGTGNYYVCGNTGANPTLFQVPISGGTFGTAVEVAQLAPPFSNPACSPVTAISNPNSTNGTAERAFVSVENSGQVCTDPSGCLMNFVITPWQPSTEYNVGQQVLVRVSGVPDVLFIQVAVAAGTSGATMPAWQPPDVLTADNTVGWLNQGRIDDVPFAIWEPNTVYNIIGQRILASNGRLQLVDETGTSGGSEPTWTILGLNNQTPEGPDGLVWRDAGPPPAVAIAASSGTSGIIIDNTVDVGILLGTSQIYFSTLGDQLCPTAGGTGECAVQASQPLLQ